MIYKKCYGNYSAKSIYCVICDCGKWCFESIGKRDKILSKAEQIKDNIQIPGADGFQYFDEPDREDKKQDLQEIINYIFNNISVHEYEIFRMRVFEKKSIKQISAKCKLTRQTIAAKIKTINNKTAFLRIAS